MFFPKAMAYFEDVAFISGTGVGEPQGFLNAPAAIKLNSANENEIAFSDIAAMFTRMWPPSLRNAVWLCSPDAFALILQLSLSIQRGTAPDAAVVAGDGSPGGGSGDGVNYTLMGRPLVVSEKIPSALTGNTTTAGALSFVDLAQYLVGDRQSHANRDVRRVPVRQRPRRLSRHRAPGRPHLAADRADSPERLRPDSVARRPARHPARLIRAVRE